MHELDTSVARTQEITTSAAATRARTKQHGRARLRPRMRPPTHPLLSDLLSVLDLERLERDLFRGESRDSGAPQVFGGQVIAQALAAASATVDGREVHSLHAYFLRRGDVAAPIVYQVERPRDGASFSSRRVSATQHGEEILHMSASFQRNEDGFEHQFDMPWVPPPEDLPGVEVLVENSCADMPATLRNLIAREKPFEFRFADPLHFMPGAGSQCVQHLWFRAVGRLPDDPALHQRLLAYASDYYLLATATRSHGADTATRLAISIDHAIWFHRPARIDEWLLYSIDSPSASGARGFTRASIFTRDGRLAASTAQEGLMRRRGVSHAPLERNS
jgi:acyl-CoA thioesterase-2